MNKFFRCGKGFRCCCKERLADVAVALRPEIGALSVDEQAKALSGQKLLITKS